MKKIIFFFIYCISPVILLAQSLTFDLTTCTPPKGWVKQTTQNAIQFTKNDDAKGTYCLITLYKAIPGTLNSKENFDLAWTSLVKQMVTVSAAPDMQPISTENGWEVQSGFAPFESEGTKGVALLLTGSSAQKMVNIIILTNTDVYQQTMSDFLESISLKKQTEVPTGKTNPVTNPVTVAKSDGFAFNTTNFDNGWTATVQDDWVQVSKANLKVLIHYPNKRADAYNSVLMDGLKNAWNILVSTRYMNASNMEFKPVSGWQSIEFAEADMTEKASGKKVHVVFFKMNYSNGSGRYMEFITPDKKTFEANFMTYRQESYGWEPLEKFQTYNKFAVAASDLKGKWTNDFSGAIQYVNASTGFDSHMDTHTSVENFTIGNNNTYNWDLAVASGPVGNIKFQTRKSAGKLSMTGNWKINFSDIEGRARSYDVSFSCIKGLRILWLDGRAFAKVQ